MLPNASERKERSAVTRKSIFISDTSKIHKVRTRNTYFSGGTRNWQISSKT